MRNESIADRIVDEKIQAIEEQIEKLNCDHLGQRLVRYRLASNGVKMFKVQCTRCGELIGDWIPHQKIKNIDSIQPIDDALPGRYRETKIELERELRKRQHELERGDFFDWYNEYLKTPEWSEKRKAVLDRCSGICEGCRMAEAVEVHHLTYKNVGKEFLFELVGLCKNCHDRCHQEEVEAEAAL